MTGSLTASLGPSLLSGVTQLIVIASSNRRRAGRPWPLPTTRSTATTGVQNQITDVRLAEDRLFENCPRVVEFVLQQPDGF
jgi:hypothetical protein